MVLGTIGSAAILFSFLATIGSVYAYIVSEGDTSTASRWLKTGRAAWITGSVLSFVAWGLLIYLSLTHQYQYAYIYQNTSNDLPLYFLISATWAGQEGSFLLWIVWNAIVGLVLFGRIGIYEGAVMAVIGMCQAFLLSMILGINIGPVPIGSSPFMPLWEKFATAPMAALWMQGQNLPVDGSGLNDLLKNYWMAIHPPTLFAGFAFMIVPFGFAIAAMWRRHYTQWVKPALPWTLGAVALLGVGIAMGGYWAYETLSFGGYWAWDPVENSSLVPWLVGVAALHTMIVQKRSGNSHKAALLLSILAYVLVVYSTFLTRSGILGDISVHSFVDLGLYNQLLLWILAMTGTGLGLFVYRYPELPTPKREPHIMSREFMIFSGAMLLAFTALVIILGTSTPIIGRIFRDNPSTVPIAFYNKWSLPLAVGFMFLISIGQLFWWSKMTIERLNQSLIGPVIATVIATVAVILFTPFMASIATPSAAADTLARASVFGQLSGGMQMVLFLFMSFFALFANLSVMVRIGRGNLRLVGGALSHVGFAILMLGVISSGAMSENVVPAEQAGRPNFVLEAGQTRQAGDWMVTYSGQGVDYLGHPTYLLDWKKGDLQFRTKPVAYESNRGQWIQHPEVRPFLLKDLFVAVSPAAMFESSGTAPGEVVVQRGESLRLGDDRYLVTFEDFDLMGSNMGDPNSTIQIGARLTVRDLTTDEVREVMPVYRVEPGGQTISAAVSLSAWDLAFQFMGMSVDTGEIRLVIDGVDVMPADWLVVMAYEKPLISLVWIGFIVLTVGFVVSTYRRATDVVQSRNRVQ